MIRRSFRIGLRLGLLAGLVATVLKMAQTRRKPDAEVAPAWTPPPRPAPPRPTDETSAAPAAAPATSAPDGERQAAAERRAAAAAARAERATAAASPPVVGSAVESVDSYPPREVPTRTPDPIRPAGKPATARPPAKKAAKKAAPVKKVAAPPKPAKKAAAKKAAPAKTPAEVATAWVEPSGGLCPPSHPVKAKLSSRIFHLPGMFAYDRTRPDRCYADEATATGDGLIKAKR